MNNKERVMEEFRQDVAMIPEYQEPPVAGAAPCSADPTRRSYQEIVDSLCREGWLLESASVLSSGELVKVVWPDGTTAEGTIDVSPPEDSPPEGRPAAGLSCPRCCSESEPVDICERCGEEFGDPCKTDANGYNCTCKHCGNNTYETQCPDCGRSVHAVDEYAPNT